MLVSTPAAIEVSQAQSNMPYTDVSTIPRTWILTDTYMHLDVYFSVDGENLYSTSFKMIHKAGR